ncbi:MAG: branched-chain amino acid ABC transporter permease [Firmicutes bacterium]|nr:branched-chain amino acid ABC transporter permease [Bacillota bacterium]
MIAVRAERPKAIATLFAVLAVAPFFLPNRYYIYIFNRGFANALAVIGLVILFGMGGQISLGHIAFFTLGAYTSAIFSVKLALPPAAAMPAGVVVASIWGAFLSVPAFKLSGPFLSICTVAFGEVVRLLTINLVSLTNGPYGFYGIPSLSLFGRRIGSEKAWYYLPWTLLGLAILAAVRLKRSYIGRALAAIREDETAAEVMGINVRAMKTLAFVCAAFCAGLAGGLYAHMSGFLSPESFTGEQSFSLFSMTVVGGQESVLGGVAAGVALTLLPELMRFLQEYYIMIFSLIVLLIVLLPLESIKERAEMWISALTRKGGKVPWGRCSK